jgi:hypothetical protein
MTGGVNVVNFRTYKITPSTTEGMVLCPPHMDHYCPLRSGHLIWWEYVGLYVITYNSNRRYCFICNCV